MQPTEQPRAPGEMEDLKKEEENILIHARLVFSSLGMKVFRLAVLGYLYQVYEVLKMLSDIGMRNYFTPLYLYAWTVTSLLIGFILFLFGRTTLVCDDIIKTIQQMNMMGFKVLCDGTIYRYLNLGLNWLYPYIVMTTWCFYLKVRVPHSSFVITYYSGLAILHYRKQLDFNFNKCLLEIAQEKKRQLQMQEQQQTQDSSGNKQLTVTTVSGDIRTQIRFILQLVVALSHFYICLLAGNLWGGIGALCMIYSIALVTDFGRESRLYKLFECVRNRINMPWLLVIALISATMSITQSFHHMNPPGNADNLYVPMEKVFYFDYLNQLALKKGWIIPLPHLQSDEFDEEYEYSNDMELTPEENQPPFEYLMA